MSKPKYTAVLATLSDRRHINDPSNRVIFLFEVDDNYSFARVQPFLDLNREVLGAPLRARYEFAKFKSLRKLFAWTDRKWPGKTLPLLGWVGPMRLAPEGGKA